LVLFFKKERLPSLPSQGNFMKAAVLYSAGSKLVIEDVQIDKPAAHEVLIRTAACGLCHSDLSLMEGRLPAKMPVILGHEAAGVVEAVGSEVRGIAVGDHVVTCLTAYCGHCEDCLTGHMALCLDTESSRKRGEAPRLAPMPGREGRLTQAFGLSGFAEQMLVHERTCVVIRKDMPLDRAALIGCSVTTGVGAVVRTARIEAGSTVAIIGCGGVGLSCINGAVIGGASRIIAIDRVASKRDMAMAMGATDFIDASTTDAVEAVVEMTKGGVPYSFEAIGLKATVEQAFAMLRRGGVATMVGAPPLGTRIELDSMHLFYERRLQGSMMGSSRFPIDTPRYIDLYMQGRLKLDELISGRIRLQDINAGFEDMKTGMVSRSVIMFDA
jgi:S-(hydroxymethyl)glutathione dehydrogenase/alcohol dehydrogenase